MLLSRGSLFLLMICLLTACSTFVCRAQYHPQYSQYMFNGLALNPAYAGSREVLNIAVLHRSSQWGGVKGAPATQTFAGDFPLRNPQLALGLMVFNDRINIFRQSGAYLAYSFRVKAGNGKLSFGLQAGFDLLHEDQTDMLILQPDDPMFDLDVHSSFMPNAGAGAYYYTPDFFAGLSIPHLLAYSPGTASKYSGKLTFSNAMLYGGTTVKASSNFKIKPSALIQYSAEGFLMDINCNFLFLKEILELGVSWRSSNTLVAMAQFKIKSFGIGYAHDYAIGKPGAINSSHEIMLRYDLHISVKAVSPLYLN